MATEPGPLFRRILYVVSEKHDDKQLVLDLARAGNATVLLCAVINPDSCSGERPVRFAEGATRREARREEIERQCWLDIYAIEDEFKASGIRASVVAETGALEHIQTLASSTNCDLLVIAVSDLPDSDCPVPDDLLRNLPCPVLITPSS